MLVSELIQYALVELGIADPDESITNAEAQRGLIVVQGMYDGFWNASLFGRMDDVIATASGEAEEFQRIQVGAYTITLPADIDDSITGDTRPPIDLCPVELVTGTGQPQKHLYDGTLADWVRLDGLALTDDAPLYGRDQYGLICTLASQLGGARASVPATVAAAHRRFMSMLTTKRASPRRVVGVDYF